MGQSHCDYNKTTKLIKHIIIIYVPLQNLYPKINYKYEIRIPCIMSMNIFDPNECVNKDKYPVCMYWTKKIYISICSLCTRIKINYENI